MALFCEEIITFCVKESAILAQLNKFLLVLFIHINTFLRCVTACGEKNTPSKKAVFNQYGRWANVLASPGATEGSAPRAC